MTSQKSERLLNLLITLLVARHYVTKERIRSAIDQYREQGDEAFEKMFERDKEELRSLGVPIEVGAVDRAFDDEPGYRIRRDDFELPQLDLTADEAAVVGLAARVWEHAGIASATSDALRKLSAGGVVVDWEALDVVQPTITAAEPAFEPLWRATERRVEVSFDYKRPGDAEPARRRLQPWGVVSFWGRWYVVGHDVDRGAPRLFRLSRIGSAVRTESKTHAFTVPDGTDLRALTRSLAPEPAERRTAVVLLRPGTGHALRRRGEVLTTAAGPDGEPWDRVSVEFAELAEIADEVLQCGPNAVAQDPPELRELVVERLRALVMAP